MTSTFMLPGEARFPFPVREDPCQLLAVNVMLCQRARIGGSLINPRQ